MTHLSRTSDCLSRGVRRGARLPHAPARICPICFSLSCHAKHERSNSEKQSTFVFGITRQDRRISDKRPRSRHRSSKPNLKELGGKARGSIPPRATRFRNRKQEHETAAGFLDLLLLLPTAPDEKRSSSSWQERSSHKREGAGSTPASATKFYSGL